MGQVLVVEGQLLRVVVYGPLVGISELLGVGSIV